MTGQGRVGPRPPISKAQGQARFRGHGPRPPPRDRSALRRQRLRPRSVAFQEPRPGGQRRPRPWLSAPQHPDDRRPVLTTRDQAAHQPLETKACRSGQSRTRRRQDPLVRTFLPQIAGEARLREAKRKRRRVVRHQRSSAAGRWRVDATRFVTSQTSRANRHLPVVFGEVGFYEPLRARPRSAEVDAARGWADRAAGFLRSMTTTSTTCWPILARRRSWPPLSLG